MSFPGLLEVVPPEGRQLIRAEVDYLCRKVFRITASDAVIESYLKFHEIYQRSLATQQHVDMRRLMKRKLDAEAVEFFLRSKKRKNVLSSKIWLCAYLLGEYAHTKHLRQEEKIERNRRYPVSVLGLLTFFGMRSAWKWLKGGIISYSHNLT